MNPVEWLIYAATWKLWCKPRVLLTEAESFACTRVLAEAHRRG